MVAACCSFQQERPFLLLQTWEKIYSEKKEPILFLSLLLRHALETPVPTINPTGNIQGAESIRDALTGGKL